MGRWLDWVVRVPAQGVCASHRVMVSCWENHPPASVSHYLFVSWGPDSEVSYFTFYQEGERWMPLFVPYLRTGEDATKTHKFKFQNLFQNPETK